MIHCHCHILGFQRIYSLFAHSVITSASLESRIRFHYIVSFFRKSRMLDKHKKKRPRTQDTSKLSGQCKRSRIASTQCPEIRKLKLPALSESSPLSDAEFKELHASFEDEYESLIITADPEKPDLERALWMAHHMKITEFRAQMQKQEKTKVSRRNHKHSVAPLLAFVESSSKFYITLVSKLRVKYGLTETSSGLDGWESEEGHSLDEMQICYVTCHQLLMRLGDLARYKEVYGVQLKNRDYSTAERYYRQASRLCYCEGGPHNQLAVLATHVRDDIRAVYYYLRSKFTKVSSPSSHDNLAILLSKEEKCLSQEVADPKFSVHFLKVAGILLIKTDSFKDLQSELDSALKELQEQLACQGPEADDGKSRAFLGIQMVVTLMSGVIYNIPKPKTFLHGAFMAAFKFVHLLISLTIDDPIRTMLPAVVTFFIWLASHEDIVKATSEADELRRSFLDVLMQAENLFLALSLVAEESLPKSSNSDELTESRNDIALWEDRELQGFSPLDAHFDKLNFKAGQSDDKQANAIRVQRLVASLNTITLVAGLSENLIGLSSRRETLAIVEQNMVADSQYLESSQKLQQPSSLTLGAELSKDLDGLSFMDSQHSPLSSTLNRAVPTHSSSALNIGDRSLPCCLTNYEDILVPEKTCAKPQKNHSMQEQVPVVDVQSMKGSFKGLQTCPDFQMDNSKQPVEQPQQTSPSLSRKILWCSQMPLQSQQSKMPCPGELVQGKVQCGSASVNLDDECWFDSLTHIKPLAAVNCDPRLLQSTSVCGLKNLERYQTRNPFVILRNGPK